MVPLTENDDVPEGLLDDRLRAFYNLENELTGSMLIDLQSGNEDVASAACRLRVSPTIRPFIFR
ncbi:hypothetical protein ACLK1T_01955 [Escherichia coli]